MINSLSQVTDWPTHQQRLMWVTPVWNVANVCAMWSCRNLWLWLLSKMAQLETVYCIFVFLHPCMCVLERERARGGATWAPIIGPKVWFYCSVFRPGVLCVQLWWNYIVMQWNNAWPRQLKYAGRKWKLYAESHIHFLVSWSLIQVWSREETHRQQVNTRET